MNQAEPAPSSETPSSETLSSTPKRLILSKRGLLILMVLLMGSPIALIGVVWATLPPTSDTPLPAKLRFKDFVQIEQYKALPEREKEKIIEKARQGDFIPAIIVKNDSQEDWNNVGISLNRSFDFFSAEPLPAGEEREFLLHQFQTRQGDLFRPLDWEIREVKVTARINSGARAIYETKVDPYGRIEQDSRERNED